MMSRHISVFRTSASLFIWLAVRGSVPAAGIGELPGLYGPPVPAAPAGPPLPSERLQIIRQAERLASLRQSGHLRLTVASRDGEQIRSLARSGVYLWPAPLRMPIDAYTARRQSMPGVESSVNRSRISSRHASPAMRTQLEIAPEGPGGGPIVSRPSSALLQLLLTLARRSTPRRPLELLSFLRPPYRMGAYRHVGPRNPHSLGMAVDIAAYGGYKIRTDSPESCVQATLAILRDLPRGTYRMGVPKAPEPPLTVGRPRAESGVQRILALLAPEPSTSTPHIPQVSAEVPGKLVQGPATDREPAPGVAGTAWSLYLGTSARLWPFFPEQEVLLENGLVAPLRRNGQTVTDGTGRPVPAILRFRNEAYAPAEDLQDPRLRHAIQQAARRGASISALFPDAADHIHIDVRPR